MPNYEWRRMMNPQLKESDMPTATAAPKVEKYVSNALTHRKIKVSELTPEQKIRALAAPEEKGGLRGQSLVEWIMDAKNTSAQIAEARAADAAANGKPKKTREPKVPAAIEKYGADAVAATERANTLLREGNAAPDGYTTWPKQHIQIRDAVIADVGPNPTGDQVLAASGFATRDELVKVAQGLGSRTDVKPLHPLMAKIANGGRKPWWRYVAVALVAWIEQLDA